MPEFVNESRFGALIAVIGVIVLTCIVAGLMHLTLSSLIKYSQRNSPHTHHARILSASRGPAVLFVIILGIFLAYSLLIQTHILFDFADEYHEWAVRVWLVAVIAQASYLAVRIIQELMSWYEQNVSMRTESNLDDVFLPEVRRMIPIAIYTVGSLMALEVVGVEVAPLIAGLGIGGIAVALALQPTLSNLLSGTFMVHEGELNEGDFIELEGGPSGIVVDVSWRSTKIRDRDNNLVMIPNSKLMEGIATNYYSHSKVMTVRVQCGVKYGSNLERVEELVLEAAAEVKEKIGVAVDDFDPVMRFTAFGESNIDFVVEMQVEDRLGTSVVTHELIKRLYTKFEGAGIEMST